MHAPDSLFACERPYWYEPERRSNPTDALPGTAEKVEVLAARLSNGQPLFNPNDAGSASALAIYLRIFSEVFCRE